MALWTLEEGNRSCELRHCKRFQMRSKVQTACAPRMCLGKRVAAYAVGIAEETRISRDSHGGGHLRSGVVFPLLWTPEPYYGIGHQLACGVLGRHWESARSLRISSELL